MDPDGQTPWYMILSLFAYAAIGWAALMGIHVWLRRRSIKPSARQAAQGYGASWQTNTQSDA